MILISFVFLITINSFVVPNEHSLLNCYYYRYMLYSFTMHGINIGNTLKNTKHVPNKQLYVQIERHEDELRTQGTIAIAMLEELIVRNPSSDMNVLMKLNLYLNNVLGSPMIRTIHAEDYVFGGISVSLASDSSVYIVAVKEVFQKFHEYIVKHMREHIETKCNNTNPIVRDTSITSPEIYGDLNDLLPENYNDIEDNSPKSFIKAMETFNGKTATLCTILKATSNKQENSIFNPKKILFHEILNRQTYKDGELLPPTAAELDTTLDLLRNVLVTEQLKDGRMVNMTILFEIIKRCYEPSHVKHFQRQVLAATVCPVLKCIGFYLLLVSQIYCNDSDKFDDGDTRAEKYGKIIDNIGGSILIVLNKFIALKLLPKSVQTHLTKTMEGLSIFNKFADKKNIQTKQPRWIGALYKRCSEPMEFNLLLFDVVPLNIRTEDEFVESIDNLKVQIKQLDNYILALKKYKNDFFNVSNNNALFSHECMFKSRLTFNIVYHYKDAFDKILKHISTD